MKDITLNNGVPIPQLGFGTFKIPPAETQHMVEHALRAGYRHIDTAAAYGNEEGVGAALRAVGLPRAEVFVTTKLRNGEQGYESALAAFEDSRRRLGLDVIDLYLIHWPVPSKDLYVETWRAFEKLLTEGAVRAIGVSNFLPEHLERLGNETEIVPAVNQIEVHPTFQQRATQSACRALGIAVEAYSPLGRGKGLDDETIQVIAAAHEVTAAQVVLRWHLQQDRIAIPKSARPERINENFNLDFTLSMEEIRAIDALNTDERVGADPATADFSQMG